VLLINKTKIQLNLILIIRLSLLYIKKSFISLNNIYKIHKNSNKYQLTHTYIPRHFPNLSIIILNTIGLCYYLANCDSRLSRCKERQSCSYTNQPVIMMILTMSHDGHGDKLLFISQINNKPSADQVGSQIIFCSCEFLCIFHTPCGLTYH